MGTVKEQETLKVNGRELCMRVMKEEEVNQLAALDEHEGWHFTHADFMIAKAAFPQDIRGAFDSCGQLIGCCIHLSVTDDVSYIGWYVVKATERGKGIGKAIYDFELSQRSLEQCIVTLDAVHGTTAMYLSSGFQSTDVIKQCAKGIVDVTDDTRARVRAQASDVTVTPISEDLIECVLEFDRCVTNISGPRLHCFKRLMFLDPDTKSRCVVVDSKVVGYIFIRADIVSNTYRIASFYAADVSYARLVLYDVITELPKGARLLGYFPAVNKAADMLLSEIGLSERDPRNALEFMYRGNGTPASVIWKNVFCVSDNSTCYV